MKKLKLDIQLFAEDGAVESAEMSFEGNIESNLPVVEEPSFTDLLKNPQYQREFDKLVAKANETAISNAQAKWVAEQTEAEKLAKMDAEQKTKYELNKYKEQLSALQGQVNADNLYKQASNMALEKNIPISYLGLIDFTKESAESISAKLDMIQETRNRDIEEALNKKLRQRPPREYQQQVQKIDPYIEGFLSEL